MAVIVQTSTQMLTALDQPFRLIIENPDQLETHPKSNKQLRSHHLKWEEMKSTFQGRNKTGAIVNLKHTDPLTLLEDTYFMFFIRIKNALKLHSNMKVNIVFCGLFEKEVADQVVEKVNFQTKNAAIDIDTNLKE
ncbi:hypothetical protein ILUMI_08610 [Ignelater luminosus]|uniref:Uncharacterized protein n=1 Tax=Ignelater luminosus TaxID=2038154 RepID=A0A8K0DAY6_IGNLU|nr:hypothetical protein ILUMI_08610 [Ignelater luminosus]